MPNEYARIHDLSQALDRQPPAAAPDQPSGDDQEPADNDAPGPAERSASARAQITQERMLETGDENPIS